MSREPSPRRFAIWAASLALPLVLGAAVLPLVRRHLAGPGHPLDQAAAAARGAEAVTAARAAQADAAAGGTGAAGGEAAPPRREGPTGAEISAARAAEEALAKAQRGWQRSETMAPREARPGPDGELVAPWQGFGLSVESTPAGATVLVEGREVGETPLVTSVDCTPGTQVAVRVERRPLRPASRTVRCRADALVTVQVGLTR